MQTERLQAAAVYVVDDDESFCTSMTRMLRIAGLNAFSYRCAGEFLIAQSGEEPGCILLDISMPGPSGIDLLRALASREAAPPVIFVTARDDVHTTVEMMKSGAFDYVVKPVSATRILPIVHRAMEADAGRRAARRKFADLRRRFEALTYPERTIFLGVARNRLNKQLAADLGASERTVKARRARMMEKLELSSLPELVRAATLLEAGARAEELREEEAQPHPVMGQEQRQSVWIA